MCAYTTPRTWVAAETVDEDHLNEQVRDNIIYLKTETDKIDDVSQAEPSRALETIYQNSTKIRMVVVTVSLDVTVNTGGAGDQVTGISRAMAKTGAATPPTTVVGDILNQALYFYGEGSGSPQGIASNAQLTFIVPPSHYYRILASGLNTGDGVEATIVEWHEWDLH